MGLGIQRLDHHQRSTNSLAQRDGSTSPRRVAPGRPVGKEPTGLFAPGSTPASLRRRSTPVQEDDELLDDEEQGGQAVHVIDEE